MKSFIQVSVESEFPLNNIPFGVFHLKNENSSKARCATRVGDFVVDLAFLEANKYLLIKSEHSVFNQKHLNNFIELGKEQWSNTRLAIQKLLEEKSDFACKSAELRNQFIHSLNDCVMILPITIGDYTDFNSSKNHAYNVGVMIRDPQNAIQPNWLSLPVGYHGRSSSIVVSPASFARPFGQVKGPNDQKAKHEKSKKVDFELEVGMIVGKSSKLGEPIDIKNAWDHIFGFVLLNDVSLRDVQVFEYAPLGPFTSKNCITVISPWIVLAETLQKNYEKLESQNPAPLEYLQDPNYGGFNVEMEATLKTEKFPNVHVLSKSNMKNLYWSFGQQLTHHTVSGCNMNVGDLLGSGTISGTSRKEVGSFIELSWNGKEPLTLETGEQRTFWEDGDTVGLKAYTFIDGLKIGFGDCETKMTN